ncbi:MAG: epoxyqueuosine reductase QueH [Candidatus Shapirobacteria bacterium]|nr:epoxyqueuosine reductase QueH [Candidatus Shapirobacteria bacterium]
MKILIHACCADCLLKFIDSIKRENKEIDDIVVYFYNPNIHPRSEYLARLNAIKKISEENKIKLIVADWSPREWFERIKPTPPSLKKGGNNLTVNRCEKCWRLRLGKTFEYAKEKGFEVVSSTLITSHYQDQNKIETISKELENKYQIKFLIPKKVSKDLKTTGFYKQNYCGCCYSLVEAWGEKF